MTERQLRLLRQSRTERPPFNAPSPAPARVPETDDVLRPARDAGSCFPEAFAASSAPERAELARRVLEGGCSVYDTIGEQLAELIETRLPELNLSPVELRRRVALHLDGAPLAHHGTWFLYPWSRRAVHVLPESEFRELRSSRNRNKITTEEQERLRALRIGIVGLSVGSATAMALAMEQIGGELFIADFDRLSLSNMNRLRAGVHEIGIPKGILTARAIAELDPYLPVRPYLSGLSDDNMEAFLVPGGRPLDLLVEECDDIYVKVRVRERARALRIPVIMETSDRGLLDIERFDLEPERPLFHGLAGDISSAMVRELPKQERIPVALRIVGERTISARAAASLLEVGSTIKSWPQLASAVSLGAGAAADAARRIALGHLGVSGRFYVDLERIVSDGASAVEPAVAQAPAVPAELPAATSAALPAPQAARVGVAAQRKGAALEPEVVRALVESATQAPSGGNCQPWRFSWNGERLRLLHDKARSRSFLDHRDLASWLAFGAAVENLDLAAAARGLDVDVELSPSPEDQGAVCDLRFARRRGEASAEALELARAIPERATNRRLSARSPLAPEARDALLGAAGGIAGASLHLVEDGERLSELGEILGRGDRLRFLSKTMHREMMSEIRWTAEEAERTRDGLDVATLELSNVDLTALRVMSSWPAMEFVGRYGAGAALVRPARKAMSASCAAGLVSVEGSSREAFFAGGRAMERVWLRASALGLAFQPMAPLTYLFARLEDGGEGFSAAEASTLRELRERFARVFPEAKGRGMPMLFRLAHAPGPSARALRRPVDEVLALDEA